MSVLLVGNGINLQEKLAPCWDALIKDIALRYDFMPEDSLSMTLGYEMLENRILKQTPEQKEIAVHREIASQVETDAMKQKRDWAGTVHARLTSLPFSAILTTNYDYAVERSLDPDFRRTRNTMETTYSLRRYQQAGGKTVYHIHGECGYPKSICLGYEQYAGSLQRIRESIVQNTAVDPQARDAGYSFLLADVMRGLTPRPEHSWAYDFFLTDVYILGLTLDVSEVDLWWLISYRSKLIATAKLPIKNRIVYLDTGFPKDEQQKEQCARRRKLLEAFDVECISCEGNTYTEQYGYACEWLEEHIT